jgi:hypothetical protein
MVIEAIRVQFKRSADWPEAPASHHAVTVVITTVLYIGSSSILYISKNHLPTYRAGYNWSISPLQTTTLYYTMAVLMSHIIITTPLEHRNITLLLHCAEVGTEYTSKTHPRH